MRYYVEHYEPSQVPDTPGRNRREGPFTGDEVLEYLATLRRAEARAALASVRLSMSPRMPESYQHRVHLPNPSIAVFADPDTIPEKRRP